MLDSCFCSWISHFIACMGFHGHCRKLHLPNPGIVIISTEQLKFHFRWPKRVTLFFLETHNRNCIGCCVKSPTIIADESSKGLKIQGQTVNKPVISDGFWSTSTYDLDNGTFPSQKSLSSISVSSGIGSSSNSEFVNNGLMLWNQSRLLWVGTQKSQHQGKIREAVLSWNVTYEGLLGTSKRFPQPVPLPEMVDFLVDIWDQEGLI